MNETYEVLHRAVQTMKPGDPSYTLTLIPSPYQPLPLPNFLP